MQDILVDGQSVARIEQAQVADAAESEVLTPREFFNSVIPLASKLTDIRDRELQNEDAEGRRSHDRFQVQEHHGFVIALAGLSVVAVFIALSFALVFTGHEAFGIAIIQTLVTCAISFIAGYGVGSRQR